MLVFELTRGRVGVGELVVGKLVVGELAWASRFVGELTINPIFSERQYQQRTESFKTFVL